MGIAFGILESAKDRSCVEPMAARFPGANVLLDHLNGLPLDPERHAPLIDATIHIAKYPNMHVKVTDVQGKSKEDYPFSDTYDLIECIYDAYGPQRLLWSTDFPGVMVKCSYANAVELVRTHIPFFTDDDKDWIFHKMAENIFGRLVGRSIQETIRNDSFSEAYTWQYPCPADTAT